MFIRAMKIKKYIWILIIISTVSMVLNNNFNKIFELLFDKGIITYTFL